LRNQFDRNLVFNFGHQEQIFDYAFSHLGLGEEASVEHPVVVTEPVCNPTYCRYMRDKDKIISYDGGGGTR
jgi:actin-related protein 5